MPNAIVTFTKAALSHLERTIARRGSGIGFRLSVKRTGCSGYMYVPEIIDSPVSTDLVVETTAAFAVYLDPACIPLVTGTRIDFETKQLGMAQLVFDNPNADSLCGCGESFNLKPELEQSDD